MNQDIERQLKQLSLRAPSDNLDSRVLECLDVSTERSRRRPWLWPLVSAGVAAALLIAAVAMYERPDPITPDGQFAGQSNPPATANIAEDWGFQPVRYEATQDDVNYGGTVVGADGNPYRAFRRNVVKEVRLVDEQRGIEMQFVVPEQEVILIRADSQ